MNNDTHNSINQWLSFTFGKEIYAVNMQYVQEVLPYTKPATIPGAPNHVLGMIDVRDQVITINDMQIMLNLPHIELSEQKRIIVMEFSNQVQGMLVDSVSEIIDINESEIERLTKTDEGDNIIHGTYEKNGKLYILVSVAELIGIDESI